MRTLVSSAQHLSLLPLPLPLSPMLSSANISSPFPHTATAFMCSNKSEQAPKEIPFFYHTKAQIDLSEEPGVRARESIAMLLTGLLAAWRGGWSW